MKNRRTAAALGLVALFALACREYTSTTSPLNGTQRSLNVGAPTYEEPVDTVQVALAFDSTRAANVEFYVMNSLGEGQTVNGNGSASIVVPSTRPSIVLVTRKADSIPVGFALVGSQELATRQLTINGQTTLTSITLASPLVMATTLAGLDTVRKYAIGSTPTAAAGADLEAALANGLLGSGSVGTIPQSVNAFWSAVGTNIATARAASGASSLRSSAIRTAGSSVMTLSSTSNAGGPDTMVYQSGMPNSVPWLQFTPSSGGANVWLTPAQQRGDPSITLHVKTRRAALGMAVAGSRADGTYRTLSNVEVIEAETGVAATEALLRKQSIFPPSTERQATIRVPAAEAIRYWGPDSTFRIKVQLGITRTPETMTAEEREAAMDLARRTQWAGIEGFVNNVIGLFTPSSQRGVTQKACLKNLYVLGMKLAGPANDALANVVYGTPANSAANDTVFTKIATTAFFDCVQDLSEAVVTGVARMSVAQWAKLAGIAASAPIGAAFVVVDGIPIWRATVEALFNDPNAWSGQEWTVNQTWMTDIDWSQSNGASFPTRAPGGSTITLNPRARLNGVLAPRAPGDMQATGTVTGTAQYLTSPYRLRAAGNGTGFITHSWVSGASGGRTTTQTPTIQFCSPTRYRTRAIQQNGRASDTATVRLDFVVLNHEVELPATCGGGGWVPWQTVNTQILWTNGSPGVQTQTATVAGNPTITGASFAGPGGQIRFRSIFRNPLTTPTPNGVMGEYDWTQSVMPGRIEIGPPLQEYTVRSGTTVTPSFFGTYFDANGTTRPLRVCYKGDNEPVQAGVCWPTRDIISRGIKYFRGYVLEQPGLESNLVRVNVYWVDP